MNGYIVKGIGGFYYVKTPDGIVECKPRGIFRKQKITPVAGDEVTLETESPRSGKKSTTATTPLVISISSRRYPAAPSARVRA